MKLADLKKSAVEKLNKIQDFAADPDVKKYAKFSTNMIDMAYKLKQAELKGIVNIASTIVGIASAAANSVEETARNTQDKINRRASILGLVPVDMNLIAQMYVSQHMFSNSEIIWEDTSYQVQMIVLGKMKFAIVVAKQSGGLCSWFPQYVSKEHAAGTEALDNLWETTGKQVALTTFRQSSGEDIVGISKISDLSIKNAYKSVKDGNDPAELVAKYKTYRNAGVTRAYMLVGPPGTGKTTFCFKLANILGGRILVVSPELFEREDVTHSEITSLVLTFKPNVLVFDDIDRVSRNKTLLSLLDSLRKDCPDTMIVSTVNDERKLVDALKRPGRLGATIRFDSPNVEGKKEIIRMYTEKLGSRDISNLARFMTHARFTHDYIKECCEQSLVSGDEEIKQYIQRTVADFKRKDKEGEDDDELEDD